MPFLILTLSVNVPFTKMFDSMLSYRILNHSMIVRGKLNFINTFFMKLCSTRSNDFSLSMDISAKGILLCLAYVNIVYKFRALSCIFLF